jgi:hypothetical protein
MFKREDVIVEPEYYLRGGIEVFCPDCRRVLSKGHWTVCVKTWSDRYWVGHFPPIECCGKERKVAALFDTEDAANKAVDITNRMLVRDGDTSCLRLVRAKLDPPPSFNKSFDTRLTARKTRKS